jgi:hypothetical protein
LTPIPNSLTASKNTKMIASTGAASHFKGVPGSDTIVDSARHSSRSPGSGEGKSECLREVASNVLEEKEEAHHIHSQRQNRILEGWQRLRSKRTEAQTLRVSAAELRARLDIKRKDLQMFDEIFMHRAQAFVNNSSEVATQELKQAYRQLGEARVEINLDENELESVEGKLILAEGELREVESSMYQLPVTPSAGSIDDEFDFIARERDPTESIVSSRNIRKDSSVQAQRYLSQVGEVTLLRERMMDLESHYAQVIEEQIVREDIGLALDDISELFLHRYEREHEELSSQLQEAERLLEVYRADLEERDHNVNIMEPFPDGTSLADGSSRAHSLFGKDDYFDDTIVEGSDPEGTRVSAVASTFLSMQHKPDRVYARGSGEENGNAVNKAEYINSWLLDRLRQSTREIARLTAEHAAKGIHLDAMDFRREVLLSWDRDETMQPRFATPPRDTSMTIHSGKTSESRPKTEGHLRVVEDNANANVLRRTRSARRPQTEC